MIDGRNFFDEPRKRDLKRYNNFRKIVTGKGCDYITECLLDYPYFKKILQINCNRFKQTTKTRCWFKSNTTN